MPRYIDADALYDNISDLFVEYLAVTSNNEARNIVKSLYKVILDDLVDNAPTVSPDDVRGVVHCKDCKWCHAGYCEKYDDLIPWGCANKPWEDWFCADGKRQETIKEEQDAD